MTGMRPDPDSDLAGQESEYGDDTGFAAEATRTAAPETGGNPDPVDDTGGLTAEEDDEDIGAGAD